ncbi:RNA polymerase sigma-70 factor, ECF subfamily [Amphibacillus marinus]|uniref:RNA polymerase sigma-70 factor, ECF subfamily n=1 Tax=Amphibacillus marinus TaxID=872970 RepID=A0A1H8LKX9_9BACI|nr:RNA polymerase sigma factor [Amphibacillus marinus]SEO05810.1 RNA polymerase sigma-70 factor, ECF subfamily [Amphibacillus marinus]
MDSDLLLHVYQKQAKMIYFYLRKNGCHHEDAEDIVQESYTQFMRYCKGVASDKALSYIFTTAINLFRKLLKQRGKEQVIAIDDQLFWSNFSNDRDTETIILAIEQKDEIIHTLASMQDLFRQLLLLKYDFQYSYQQISLLTGLKEETVKTYLYRARKAFYLKWREQHG